MLVTLIPLGTRFIGLIVAVLIITWVLVQIISIGAIIVGRVKPSIRDVALMQAERIEVASRQFHKWLLMVLAALIVIHISSSLLGWDASLPRPEPGDYAPR